MPHPLAVIPAKSLSGDNPQVIQLVTQDQYVQININDTILGASSIGLHQLFPASDSLPFRAAIQDSGHGTMCVG